jgi:Domain of unknown function (DUF4349)
MPSPSEPLIDERYRDLAAMLRDARPRPSERLREQVRELAAAPAAEPAPRRFRLRPLVAITAVVLATAVFGGIGLLASRGGGGGGDTAASGGSADPRALEKAAAPRSAPSTADAQSSFGALDQQARESATALPPARGRAQEYRAELSVRVRDVGALSGATAQAMTITRSLGGYIVSAAYDEPGDTDGDSTLVVRVPVGRVQVAIQRFSKLGTIVAQHISVADLQAQLDRQTDALAALRTRIARLETQLDDTTLTPEAREELKFQLLEARRTLTARQGGHAQTRRRAATARIALTLTTRDQGEQIVPVPGDDDGFGATLRDALDVLLAVVTWTLAALIVASPLILLLALLALAFRLRRRAEERRLLERPAG